MDSSNFLIHFKKLHGLGNDYLFIAENDMTGISPTNLALKMSSRRTGVGSDGIVILCNSVCADIKMRIYNADGSEAETCGNALRCISRLLSEKTQEKHFTIETNSGIVTADVQYKNGRFQSSTINMGKPRWNPSKLPVLKLTDPLNYTIELKNQRISGSCVSVGNPHFVIVNSHLDAKKICEIGPLIENHPSFPQRINVCFADLIDPSKVKLVVWERGSGLTSACGSGATATYAVLLCKGLINKKITIHLPGGPLFFNINSDNEILMTGQAEYVFSGVYFFD